MTGRGLIVTIALWLVLPGPARAEQTVPIPASQAGAVISLSALEAQALARHPAIREAEARLVEARGRARQAGAWMNPTIGITSEELRPRETPGGFVGGFIEQTIPLGGKLAAAGTEAEREVNRREAMLEAVRQQVVANVRTRFYRLAAAVERVSVTERLATHATEAVEIARQLFNVGLADQPDVLSAEVQAQQVALGLFAARAMADASWRLLGTSVAEPALPRATAPGLGSALPELNREDSLARILAGNPTLATAAREVARERASVDLARLAIRSDLFLRGEAGWNREHVARGPVRAMGWQFGVEVGVGVPMFDRNRGGIAAAGAAVTAAEAALSTRRLMLEERFAEVFGEYERARAEAESYRSEILPRAEQAHTLYLAKYRQMAAAYPQVLAAQRALIDLTGEYVEALDRAWRSALRIQSLLVEDASRD